MNPTIDNFCFFADIKTLDTRSNKRFQNYKDKEKNISSFCPYSGFFKNGVYGVLS